VGAALIGPNALTQLLDPIARRHGSGRLSELLDRAGIAALPDMTALIAEAPVAKLHRDLRQALPETAPAIAREAGIATARYILAYRIPKPAQTLLRLLPAALAGRLLAKAIAKNAWTFAGSGRFRIAAWRPLTFEIADNPLVRGETAQGPLCHWHVAVFETLLRSLADPKAHVIETDCCAAGSPVCRFVVESVQSVR